MKLVSPEPRPIQRLLSLRVEVVELAASSERPDLDALPIQEENLLSQTALAGFSLESRGIVGTSLNTCKKNASLFLPGGYQQLDAARRAALECLRARPNRDSELGNRSRESLLERIRELQRVNGLLREDLSHISDAFLFAVRCCRSYATETHSPSMLKRHATDEREMFARASLVKSRLYSVGGGGDGKTTAS
jgi:hypothetical protein